MKLSKILLNNISLKLLALLLALVTWFYIGEATKLEAKKMVIRKFFSPSHYVSKKLYIKPIFVGKVPEGYKFVESDVKVMPEFVIVVGPANILSEKEFIYAKPIDLSENTKVRVLDMKLESFSPSIRLQKANVQIYLPIEKLEEGKKK